MDPVQLIAEVVLPAGVAATVLLIVSWTLTRRPRSASDAEGDAGGAHARRSRPALAAWLAALAAGAGFAASFPFVTDSWPHHGPMTGLRWVFWLTLGAVVIAGLLEASDRFRVRWVARPVVVAALMAGVGWLVGWSGLVDLFDDSRGVAGAALAGVALVGTVLWLSLSTWLGRDGGWASALGVWVWCATAAGALLPSGQAKAALLFGVLAAVAGALVVVRLMPGCVASRAAGGPIATAAVGLLIVAYVGGRYDAYFAAAPLVVAGPIAGVVVWLIGERVLGKKPAWVRGLIAVGVVAVLGAAGAGLTKAHFDRLDAEGGGYEY